jgi:hypothetical protein
VAVSVGEVVAEVLVSLLELVDVVELIDVELLIGTWTAEPIA